MSRHLTWILALLFSSAAWAQGPQWQYRLEGTPKPGQKAALVLVPQNDVYEVEVVLRAEGGGEQRFKFKKLPAGKEQRVAWAVPPGESRWTGTLTGSADGATTTAPLELKVVSVGALDVKLDKRDVDLALGQITVLPTHRLKSAEIAGFDEEGRQVLSTEVDLSDQPPGRAVIAFEPPTVPLKRLEMKIHDPYGYWVALRIASWYAEIAHDDVEFESGKHEVRASEAHKIDAAIEALENELARFRAQLPDESVDAAVYVAGYTDTVGSPGDNQALSLRRAEAIARYFRAHGVRLPIFYQGFGEKALAVPTPDDTDEARNRRAVYVLSNTPPGGPQFPGGGWKPLK